MSSKHGLPSTSPGRCLKNVPATPAKSTAPTEETTEQGPREGWAEGALAPPPHFLAPLKKNNNEEVGNFISE